MRGEGSVVGPGRKFEKGAMELRVKDDNRDGSVFLRADMIDFKSWDVQLDKHLSRACSRNDEAQSKPEEWEIDLAKLDIKNVIAHGTYGTVYKGLYDGQDVAGNTFSIFMLLCLRFNFLPPLDLVLDAPLISGKFLYTPLISFFKQY